MCNLVILRTITHLNSCLHGRHLYFATAIKFHLIIFPCCLHGHLRFMRFSATPLTRFEISVSVGRSRAYGSIPGCSHAYTHLSLTLLPIPCSLSFISFLPFRGCRLSKLLIGWDFSFLVVSYFQIWDSLLVTCGQTWLKNNFPLKRLRSIILYFTRGVAFVAVLYSWKNSIHSGQTCNTL